jgi:hypothetical protein
LRRQNLAAERTLDLGEVGFFRGHGPAQRIEPGTLFAHLSLEGLESRSGRIVGRFGGAGRAQGRQRGPGDRAQAQAWSG